MISNDYELLDSLDLLYCFKTSFKRYLIPDIGDQCLCDTSQPPDPVARPVQVRELVREPPVAAEDGDTAQDVLGLRRPAPLPPHGETTNVIRRDAKVPKATRAQITSFMRSPLIIFADPFIVILTWNMLKRLLLGFSRNLQLE